MRSFLCVSLSFLFFSSFSTAVSQVFSLLCLLAGFILDTLLSYYLDSNTMITCGPYVTKQTYTHTQTKIICTHMHTYALHKKRPI